MSGTSWRTDRCVQLAGTPNAFLSTITLLSTSGSSASFTVGGLSVRAVRSRHPARQQYDARAKAPGIHQSQPCTDALDEQAPPPSEDYRVYEEPVHVDEVVLHERPDQANAAGSNDVPAGLLLQCRDLVFERATQECCVLPFSSGYGTGLSLGSQGQPARRWILPAVCVLAACGLVFGLVYLLMTLDADGLLAGLRQHLRLTPMNGLSDVLATVTGNLIENAFDAVDGQPRREVQSA